MDDDPSETIDRSDAGDINHEDEHQLWQKKLGERLQKLQEEMPLLPPEFCLPRAPVSDWDRLYEGPATWMGKIETTYQPKNSEAVDAALHIENHIAALCAEDRTKRESRVSWMRKYGCQISFFIALVLVVSNFLNRRSTGFQGKAYSFFLVLWFYCIFASIRTWTMTVVKLASAVFLWLGQTYDEVQYSGNAIVLQIRREIFLRVFGLIGCDRHAMPDLLQRLRWRYGFSTTMNNSNTKFAPSQILADETVETGCYFVTDEGEFCRFVWQFNNDVSEEDLTSNQLVQTKIRKLNDDFADTENETMSEFLSKRLDFFIDIQSSEVTRIVRKNPWWEKLEFQLRAEQSNISGFRSYLGEQVFNSKERMRAVGIFYPCMFTCFFGLGHVALVSSNPYVFGSVEILPHVGLVLGFMTTLHCLMVLAAMPSFARFVVNMVMTILEKQVRKDWALVMGSDSVVDPDELYQKEEEVERTQSIPKLWQVVSCESSVKQTAHDIWNDILTSGLRRNKHLAARAIHRIPGVFIAS
eukprot:TRINITY_DN22321_c0_g1_i1.p1 TRINITY_DN22321_c0_g1~~TRINITY_DN22321_c0_g1_i1.p1  ORF type:complete len:596 (-),score=92.10 TRINITY_DN22321_c0_g1_i1:41-1615(-)